MIYISGKISNLPEDMVQFNFKKVIDRLVEIGIERNEIVSPLDLGIPGDTPSYKALAMCYSHFRKCDSVFFMENWKESTGCIKELDWAMKADKARYFEEFNGFSKLAKTLVTDS
jgi:hypothetical protein